MESNRRLAFKKIGAGLATIFGFSISAKASEKPAISPEEAERLQKTQRYNEISKDLIIKLYAQNSRSE